MPQFMLHNGKIQPVSQINVHPEDRGLLYGFSLFETMLVLKGQVLMLDRHLKRLVESAAELDINITGVNHSLATSDQLVFLSSRCNEAVKCAGITEGVLRLTATAGTSDGGHGRLLISARPGLPYPREKYEKGFALKTLSFPRHEKSPLVRHKTANYLENLLGRREIRQGGYDEGIFLNTAGKVAEGTVSNLFLVRDKQLFTPPPDAGLLPGTVRRLVLERSPHLGYQCWETNLTPAELQQADECFLTNSLMGIMPVTSMDGAAMGHGGPGPVTTAMMQIYPGSGVTTLG